MLKDYQGALNDLDKADVLEPDNAFTLSSRGKVKRMLKVYQGALNDLDKADVLELDNAFTLSSRGDVKRLLKDYQGAVNDLDKADVLEPNNAFTLSNREDVKYMLDDYQRALNDLDKADFLEPNNAFTLRTRVNVKRMLENYQRALNDFDKTDVLEPNNAFTLRSRENMKRMLKDCQGALNDLDKANVLEPNNAFTLRSHGDEGIQRCILDVSQCLPPPNEEYSSEPPSTLEKVPWLPQTHDTARISANEKGAGDSLEVGSTSATVLISPSVSLPPRSMTALLAFGSPVEVGHREVSHAGIERTTTLDITELGIVPAKEMLDDYGKPPSETTPANQSNCMFDTTFWSIENRDVEVENVTIALTCNFLVWFSGREASVHSVVCFLGCSPTPR
jgi:tetratricopeptide (TPR) repeat protein